MEEVFPDFTETSKFFVQNITILLEDFAYIIGRTFCISKKGFTIGMTTPSSRETLTNIQKKEIRNYEFFTDG